MLFKGLIEDTNSFVYHIFVGLIVREAERFVLAGRRKVTES